MLGFLPPPVLAPPILPKPAGPNPIDTLPANPLDPWYWPPLPKIPVNFPDLPDWLFPPPPAPDQPLPSAPLPSSPDPAPVPDPVPGETYNFPANPADPTTDVRWDIEYTVRDQQFPLPSCVTGIPDPAVDELFTYTEYVTGTALRIKVRQGQLISDGCDAGYQGFHPDNISKPNIEGEYFYSDNVWRPFRWGDSVVGNNRFADFVEAGLDQKVTTTIVSVKRNDIELPIPEPIPDPVPKERPLVLPDVLPQTAPKPKPLPLPLPEPEPLPDVDPLTEPAPDPNRKPAPGPAPQPVPVPNPVPGPIPVPGPDQPDPDGVPDIDPIPTPPLPAPAVVPTAPKPALTPEGAWPISARGPRRRPTVNNIRPTSKGWRFYSGVDGPITPGGGSNGGNQTTDEIGRIEQKTASGLDKINTMLNFLGILLEALDTTYYDGTEYQLQGVCEELNEDDEQPVVQWFIPEDEQGGAMITRLDSIAEMLQAHLRYKTPTCGTRFVPEGDWRTINFRSSQTSPFGKSKLRKRFRYRSQNDTTNDQLVDHWKDFTWTSGAVCVIHKGSTVGVPQVWAETEEEGKRVIRHAFVEAGLDPDDVGEWIVTSSSSGRVGVSGEMSVDTRGGFYWITARDGSNGRPQVART